MLSQTRLLGIRMRNFLGSVSQIFQCIESYRKKGSRTQPITQFQVKLSSFRDVWKDICICGLQVEGKVVWFSLIFTKAYNSYTDNIWIVRRMNIFIFISSLYLSFKKLE